MSGLKMLRKGWEEQNKKYGKDKRKASIYCPHCKCHRVNACLCEGAVKEKEKKNTK